MKLLGSARRNPSAVLPVVQLLGMLVHPAMEGSPPGRVAVEIPRHRRTRARGRLRPRDSRTHLSQHLPRHPGRRTVIARRVRPELFATGATFTLVAWGFAYLYVFVQVVSRLVGLTSTKRSNT